MLSADQSVRLFGFDHRASSTIDLTRLSRLRITLGDNVDDKAAQQETSKKDDKSHSRE